MEDQITIPKQDVATLDHIVRGVKGLRILFVNAYLLSTNDTHVLIDAGLPGTGGHIRRWTEEVTNGKKPDYILLTHGHFDHAGAAKELADYWSIPVYAHPLEEPYLNGTRAYPPPDPAAGGGLMAVLSPLYPAGPFSVQPHLRLLEDRTSVPGLPEWRWLHTPGHTEGHISLFRDSDRTLIVGDAFFTTKAESFLAVATQRPEMHGPPAYYTSDWQSARRSVEQLAALEPATAVPGHGLPISGAHVAATLSELAGRFDEVAIPEHLRMQSRT